jgi:uncharacterized protein YndB with AHSA1/START domain
METSSSVSTNPSERELVITRVFDAPRSLVFKAWTEPEHLVKWLGPQGFSGTVLRHEPRAGGAYRYHMRDPQGGDHWQQGVYREIVPPERFVCTYAWADADGNPTRPETLLTVTFEERGGKTKLTLRQAFFESVTARDDHQGGWNSSLDRLADYLTVAR